MTTMPSLFISHGAPTFAIEPGLAGAQLRALGRALGKPRAIVVVSPHWMTRGVEITATERPETVHDFGGFPRRSIPCSTRPPALPSWRPKSSSSCSPRVSRLALTPAAAWTMAPGCRCCISTPTRMCR